MTRSPRNERIESDAPASSMSLAVAALASAAFHGAVLVGWLVPNVATIFAPAPAMAHEVAPAAPQVEEEVDVDIDLPVVSEGSVGVEVAEDPRGVPPVPMGGSTVARVDDGHAGHGGDRTASAPAINLSDLDERMTLTLDLANRLDRSQLQRLKSSDRRAAWEDRRSTTNPGDDAFVQNGDGSVREKRARAERDPSRGALALARRAAALGGDAIGSDVAAWADDATLGARDPSDGPGDAADEQTSGRRSIAGATHVGSREEAPGSGLARSMPGIDHRPDADGARARPDVAQAPPSVPATDRDRPNDDQFSYQEVARRVQDIVHASPAGGLAADEGRGGTGGGGAPGAGGDEARGSSARPLGASDGDTFELYSNDPRLLPYFGLLRAKVQPLWANAFPKSAIADLKQGTVIFLVTVHADGSAQVAWPPMKPSGIDEFDRNCADALRRASPFPPIPAALGRSSLRIRWPFVAKNPIIK